MKKIFLISLLIVQACIAFSQNNCENDTIVREIQFPMTERDTETVFYYFNNEWIPLAYENEILRMKMKFRQTLFNRLKLKTTSMAIVLYSLQYPPDILNI